MTDSGLLRETNAYLHEKIPLTRAMGAEIVFYDEDQIVIAAPLALNHNHLGTAFGGSLNSLATLAGYAFLWLALNDRNAHIVIRESRILFHRPVQSEIRAVCRAPDQATLTSFRETFARKGKARLELKTEIKSDGVLAVEFVGTFVAIR